MAVIWGNHGAVPASSSPFSYLTTSEHLRQTSLYLPYSIPRRDGMGGDAATLPQCAYNKYLLIPPEGQLSSLHRWENGGKAIYSAPI